MGEIRIVGPGKTRGYPYPICKNMFSGSFRVVLDIEFMLVLGVVAGVAHFITGHEHNITASASFIYFIYSLILKDLTIQNLILHCHRAVHSDLKTKNSFQT